MDTNMPQEMTQQAPEMSTPMDAPQAPPAAKALPRRTVFLAGLFVFVAVAAVLILYAVNAMPAATPTNSSNPYALSKPQTATSTLPTGVTQSNASTVASQLNTTASSIDQSMSSLDSSLSSVNSALSDTPANL